MATISKIGITDGSSIQAEHITRIINSLDGTATTDIIATGSFTGSFTGNGSGLTGVIGEWDGTLNGNAQITGSLTVTGAGALVDFTAATSISESAVNITTSLRVPGSFNTDYFLAESGSYNLESMINSGGTVDIDLKHAAPLFITLPSPAQYVGSQYVFTFHRNTPNAAAYVRFGEATTKLAATVIDVAGNSFMTKATNIVSSSLGTPTPETRIDLIAGKTFWHMNIVTENGANWYSA